MVIFSFQVVCQRAKAPTSDLYFAIRFTIANLLDTCATCLHAVTLRENSTPTHLTVGGTLCCKGVLQLIHH